MKMALKLYKRRGEKGRLPGYRFPVTDLRLRLAGSMFLFICFCWMLSALVLHPYYVSVTEIEYNDSKKEIEISGKIFIDDLEYALKQEFKTNISILNEADKKRNETLLSNFFQKHLKLMVDGKPVTFQFAGFQREEEAIWSFMVIKDIKPFKTASVFNDLLYSFREDQVNIIHFKNKGERKSYRLTYPDKNYVFKW